MHPVLLASYFFTFLSLVVSKPYGISLSARADFCSSCKCGDLANCRTQCDKCSEAPGSCTYSDGTPCDTGQTVCDSCTYDGCKKNCQCWFYCADTAKQCPLKGGNCDTECGGYCKKNCDGIRAIIPYAICGGIREKQASIIVPLGFNEPESTNLEATVPTENVIASGDDTIKEDISIFGNEGRADSVW